MCISSNPGGSTAAIDAYKFILRLIEHQAQETSWSGGAWWLGASVIPPIRRCFNWSCKYDASIYWSFMYVFMCWFFSDLLWCDHGYHGCNHCSHHGWIRRYQDQVLQVLESDSATYYIVDFKRPPNMHTTSVFGPWVLDGKLLESSFQWIQPHFEIPSY